MQSILIFLAFVGVALLSRALERWRWEEECRRSYDRKLDGVHWHQKTML
jgi:hypothetical protein